MVFKKNIIKRFTALFCSASMLLSLTAPLQTAADSTTIYTLGSAYDGVIAIPEEYPQSISIPPSDHYEYYTDHLEITPDGIVTAIPTYWKDYGSFSASTTADEDWDYYTYSNESYDVFVYTESNSISLTINVVDYAQVYAYDAIDDFIADNITDSMTDLEKAEKLCDYICSFDYSAYHSSYVDMIIYGGGDCWASSSLAIYALTKLGIDARLRDASSDIGAGSGHRNCVALLDGEVWLLDCGFSGSAPRLHTLEKLVSLYDTSTSSEGTTITAYLGFESDVVIPELIDGSPVTAIGYGAFYDCDTVNSVQIPESVTTISEQAFSGFDELVIKGAYDSAAEIFAVAAGYTFLSIDGTLFGDVNLDGIINVRDVAFAAKYNAGLVEISDAQALKNFDINRDTELNIADVTMIAAYVCGTITLP